MENGICHSPPPTPSLVFGTNGGLGTDCNFKFLKRPAEKISQKNEEPCHITFTWISNLVPNSGKVPGERGWWIRTLLAFEIFKGLDTHA